MAIPVIVVDPDEEYRELTVKTLEGTGQYKASSATSVHEAAEILSRSKIQIAIVDMDVAQDQGDIFLRKIREDHPHLLLIAIVGNWEVHTSLVEELGIAVVIEKPYFLPELPSIIKNLIHPPTTKPPPDIQTDSDPGQLFDDIPETVEPVPEVDSQLLEFDPARHLAQIPPVDAITAEIETELFQATPDNISADILSALEPTADIDQEFVEAKEHKVVREDVSIPQSRTTSESDPTGIEPTQDPPHWLNYRTQAAEYLTQLFQEHSAQDLFLLRDGELWAWSQHFSEDRARSVVQTLRQHKFAAEKQESIFRYIRFEGEDADFLLYTIPVISTYTLVLLYEADKPFSLARRQAKFLSQLLSNPEPSDRPLAESIPAIEDKKVPEGQDQRSGLPGDWVPLSPASDEEIPILADLDVPPPDPVSEIKEPQDTGLNIPSDWHPKQPMPAAHLPFLEADEPLSASQSEPVHSEPERDHNLPFTAILLPHSPELQLNQSTSERISEWTKKLCLAWGWEAEIIEVLPDHMRLTLNLSPDIAPGQAIKHITIDISTRLIEAYPDQYGNLPSGQFWSNHYFLSSGKDITSDQLQSFMKAARKA